MKKGWQWLPLFLFDLKEKFEYSKSNNLLLFYLKFFEV